MTTAMHPSVGGGAKCLSLMFVSDGPVIRRNYLRQLDYDYDFNSNNYNNNNRRYALRADVTVDGEHQIEMGEY